MCGSLFLPRALCEFLILLSNQVKNYLLSVHLHFGGMDAQSIIYEFLMTFMCGGSTIHCVTQGPTIYAHT